MDKENLLEAILNDSNQMIQVSDIDTYTMMYANDPAIKYAKGAGKPYKGEPCYKYMMGLDEQCPFCPMRNMGDNTSQEAEVDNGNQIFAVKTKIIDWNGKKAFIEYAWDITSVTRSQKIFEAQMRTLLQSIPHAQGIFHLDLTDDTCLTVGGISRYSRHLPKNLTVNQLITEAAKYIPDSQEREIYIRVFSREALKAAHENGDVQISRELRFIFDDDTVKYARITARLTVNPANAHLECIIYGIDINNEKQETLKYEEKTREQFAIFDALSKDYVNVYLIDPVNDSVKLLKLDGYVIDGLDINQNKTYPYYATCKQYVSERVHPEDVETMLEAMKLENVMKEIREKGECVSTYRILVGGETHYFQYKYTPLEHSDNIIAGFQNIDQLIAKEKKQHDILEAALAEAERSNHAKTTFLNSISHDIRTPLNAIIGFTALAASHSDDPDSVNGYLQKITTSSNHLLSLINDVLDMSHIESGKINIEEAPVHLSDLLNDLRMIILPNVSSNSLGISSGLAMCPFIPALRAVWRSSSNALAVMANIGISARARNSPLTSHSRYAAGQR